MKNLKFRLITEEKDILKLRVVWNSLLDDSTTSVFQSFEWFISWKKAYASNSKLHFIIAENENSEVLGILPLLLQKRYIFRNIKIPLFFYGLAGKGIGGADHMGVITKDKDIGLQLVRFGINNLDKSLYLEGLVDFWASLILAIPGAKLTREIPCPRNVRESKNSFSSNWTTKFKKNIRRRQRIMDSLNVSYEWNTEFDSFKLALVHLKKLHFDRWNSKGGKGLFDDKRELFLTDLRKTFTADDIPVILLMKLQDEVIGGLLGFRFRNTFSVYKTGWDPNYTSLGIGIALGIEAMRWAENEGLIIFDYLKGDRGHKKDLGCIPRIDKSILFPKGFSGLLLEFREKYTLNY